MVGLGKKRKKPEWKRTGYVKVEHSMKLCILCGRSGGNDEEDLCVSLPGSGDGELL